MTPNSPFAKLISFLFFCLLIAPAYAQFAFNIGGTGTEEGRSIARDGNNDIYVTGMFSATTDFDPSSGTTNLVSAGNTDIYVAKYSSAGAYQWAFKIGGSNLDGGYGIAVDGSSNVYVTGTFRGNNVDFDPGSGTANLSATGNQDIFVAKYNSSGVYQWAIKIGSSNADYGYAIAADASGNAYVTGYYQGTADFDPGSGTASLTNAGAQDGFIAKYNSSGAYQWAIKIAGSGIDYGYGISLDGSGNVHVIGAFDGTVNFNPSGTANLTSAGMRDIFVGKYTSAGSYVWAIHVGGTDNDYGYGITTDGSSNVFITGYIAMTADMDPSGGTANLASGGGADIFFAKYNSSGAYQFAFKVGSVGNDIANAIALDGAGNILVAGYFQGVVDFDPSSGTANLTNIGADDAFIAKYSPAGAYICAFRIGTNSYDTGNGIVADAANNILVIGSFSGLADFDPGASTLNLTASGVDAFIAKYGSACTMISSINEIDPDIRMTIYPNPSQGIFELESEVRIFGLEIVNVLGERIYLSYLDSYRTSIDLRKQPEGTYFLNVSTDEGVARRKIILSK